MVAVFGALPLWKGECFCQAGVSHPSLFLGHDILHHGGPVWMESWRTHVGRAMKSQFLG